MHDNINVENLPKIGPGRWAEDYNHYYFVRTNVRPTNQHNITKMVRISNVQWQYGINQPPYLCTAYQAFNCEGDRSNLLFISKNRNEWKKRLL